MQDALLLVALALTTLGIVLGSLVMVCIALGIYIVVSLMPTGRRSRQADREQRRVGRL